MIINIKIFIILVILVAFIVIVTMSAKNFQLTAELL